MDWNTDCWDQQKDRGKFFEFLKNQNADIYVLQEYLHGPVSTDDSRVDKSALFSLCPAISSVPCIYSAVNDMKKLKSEFPKYYLATDNQFVFISRYPIKDSHCDSSGGFAVADISIFGGTYRFFNVHMMFHFNPQDVFNMKELDSRFEARKLSFSNLESQTEKCGTDYFVSGDFNSTKAMGTMGNILKQNVDAVRYSHIFIPVTVEFNGMRLWRIDYAFVSKLSKNIMIQSYGVKDPKGLSDHNPLFIKVKIKSRN